VDVWLLSLIKVVVLVLVVVLLLCCVGGDRRSMAMRQTPLTCSGHTRPVVDLAFSGITPFGYFLISACKGELANQSNQIRNQKSE